MEEGRVEIASEYGVADTGYLLEYDMLVEGKDGIDYFRVNGLPYPLRIDSPSPEKYTEEDSFRQQVTYINQYMQEVWDAVSSNEFERVCELVDINSVVDVYLMHELFKNSDVGISSFYMYKEPGDKLYFGPIWDFDKTCQNCVQNGSYVGLLAGIEFDRGEKALRTSNPIFYTLMENDEFVELVRNRWNEKSQELRKEITDFADITIGNSAAFSRNFEVWEECSDVPFEQNVIELRDWLLQRVDWLTENDWKIVSE